MISPGPQVAFNIKKGSIPIRTDVDSSSMDMCAQKGIEIMKDKTRQLPATAMLIAPDIGGAVTDVITNFWNKGQSVDEAAKALAAAIRG